MRLSRRELLQAAGAAALSTAPAAGLAAQSIATDLIGTNATSPAVNPVFLTGSQDDWPLAELAAAGCRGLELTPECLDRVESWKPDADRAGLQAICVNALPELRPYLTGSLSDAVTWRRRETLDRLLRALKRMGGLQIPFLVVAPSRLAENYQSAEQARSLLIESLRELARAGPGTVLLASAPFRLFASSGEIAGILDEVGRPNVAAALDIGHAMLAGEDPADAARTLGSRLRYVQLHDADAARPNTARLDRHLPLGQGSARRETVRAAIGDRPCAITVTAPCDPLGAVRASLAWLRPGPERPARRPAS